MKVPKSIYYLVPLLAMFACQKKGTIKPNKAPDTQFALESINRSGDERLQSNVSLSWFGTDADGYVVGYELSRDNQNWFFTTSQDSTFRFTLNSGSDTSDVSLWVRAIDNKDNRDPEPAYLRIPIKNTLPTVNWDENIRPIDSARIAFNFLWLANDLDGKESITSAEIKINDGAWTAIDKNKNLLTIEAENPTQTGTQNATVYYEGNTNTASIPGLEVGGINTFYIRVADEAGAFSPIDTAASFYLKPKTGDVLVISGHDFNISKYYNQRLNDAGVSYDVENFQQQSGKYIPTHWELAFLKVVSKYDAVFLHTDASLFTTPGSPQTLHLAELAATSLSKFSGNGGKIFINAAFQRVEETENFTQNFPIDAFTDSRGVARLPIDSAFVSQNSNFSNLKPSTLIPNVGTFTKGIEAEELYTAQLDKRSGWEGPTTTGILSKNNAGNTNFVFIALDLHLLDGDIAAANQVIDQIFNNEFNW